MNKQKHSALKKLGREPTSWKTLLTRPINIYEYGRRGDKPLYKYVYWTLVNEYEMPKYRAKMVDLMRKIWQRGKNKKVHVNLELSPAHSAISEKWWNKLFYAISDK